MNQREVLAMAADAKRMPAREVEYKNSGPEPTDRGQ